ncbi:MAG TPA: alanine dehydrogenase [Methylomirabilota bacterium]|jgi:alanine dehydrogenase|nr:alanine dehydrogenase [Methylomirabilota bacterium]
MKIGVPKEIKAEETRVAITPSGVAALVAHGHEVYVEHDAGSGSSIPDDLYRAAGARIAPLASAVWEQADMILKVKEPLAAEYEFLRPGLILFTYLHLAAEERLTRVLLEKQVTALGYETIQLDDGSLPLLAPMSEVAGRLAIQVGAWCLQAQNGGRGVLLSGASGVKPAHVVILGAGIAGASACQVAVGVGAHVSILDINPARLRYVHDILNGHVTTVMSNRANIEEEATSADLVISSVLVPGARTPKLLTRSLFRSMKPGAAFVDISIDQGGSAETSRPTTHHDPIYCEEGVVHYCVTNMPAIVPHTSTYALTNVTLSYALELADKGWRGLRENPVLRRGLNTHKGLVMHPGVAAAFNLPCATLEQPFEGVV